MLLTWQTLGSKIHCPESYHYNTSESNSNLSFGGVPSHLPISGEAFRSKVSEALDPLLKSYQSMKLNFDIQVSFVVNYFWFFWQKLRITVHVLMTYTQKNKSSPYAYGKDMLLQSLSNWTRVWEYISIKPFCIDNQNCKF